MARENPPPAARKARGKNEAPSSEPAPPRKPAPAPDGHVAIGEIARPHGVQGELRLKLYNPDSDLLARRPRLRLRLGDGSLREATITSAREVNKAILVRLADVEDRDAAEALRGAEILVPREAFPALEDGEFYACDIEGARAVMSSGEEVGTVTGLASYPTCDVLVIERSSGGRVEVPLLDAYVGVVDAAAGKVEIRTLDGLD